MIVRARAPLRLGLAGGGTDVAPYCDLHGGFVMNAAIDKHAYATIDDAGDGLLTLEALDRGARHSCTPASLDADDVGPLHGHRTGVGVYRVHNGQLTYYKDYMNA